MDPRTLPSTARPEEGSPPHFNRTRDNLTSWTRPLNTAIGIDIETGNRSRPTREDPQQRASHLSLTRRVTLLRLTCRSAVRSALMADRYWRTRDRRRCVECLEFIALDSRAMTCSSACRQAAYRRRLRQAERPASNRYVNSRSDLSRLPAAVRSGSVESEHREECLVDRPDLRCSEPRNSTAKALHVDHAELLDQHTSCSARDLDLGTERRRPGAARSRSDITTERGSSESDWITSPKRSPCCSCPMPLGTLKP